jgi:hypothetical protein
MCALDSQGLHERGDIVGKKLRGVDALGLVGLSAAAQVKRDTR